MAETSCQRRAIPAPGSITDEAKGAGCLLCQRCCGCSATGSSSMANAGGKCGTQGPVFSFQCPASLRQEDCALGRGDSAHGSGLEHGGHADILGATWGGRSKGAGGPSTWSLQLRLLPFLVGRGGCHLLPTLPLIDARVPISLTEGGIRYCGCSVQRPGRRWWRGASCCWGESCSEN